VKVLDIALKDFIHSLRSANALVFMFGVPLLVTGLFYLMFGNIASNGGFSLPRYEVVVANLDEGRPRIHTSSKSVPGGIQANTMGELVVNVLNSKDLADLIQVRRAPDAASARAAVDNRQAQVAIIIPPDFSHQFADARGKAVIEFYQDPTLTIGPGIVHSILSQFMNGLAGIKITADMAADEDQSLTPAQIGGIVQAYLQSYLEQDNDLTASMLTVQAPQPGAEARTDPLLSIMGPIMGGMMVFYAFYTATTSAASILREEDERTLPRLFTTPTPQSVILTGKFLAVFLTVLVQVVTLIFAARLIFGIQWGDPLSMGLAALGLVFCAPSFGIFVNSLLKDTKQGGTIYGGVITLSGMLGMISTFGGDSAAKLGNTVSLLVPQGWAVRAITQTVNSSPASSVLLSTLALLVWALVFFIIGVWRFNRRYMV
jgi:ABC-2 type transport system permease protein